MPTLHLKLVPLLNPAHYAALASALTRLSALHLGKREAVTAVVIDDLPLARWYIGGRAVQGATALLEISITAGSNTAAQKGAFIAAAYAELAQQLGAVLPFESTSYVIVRELSASDWGYGGQTQATRRRQTVLTESSVSPMALT